MKKKTAIVPEFAVRNEPRRRAGFIPGDDWDGPEVELWQLWCRDAEGDVTRRATEEDLDQAGFVRKKKNGKGKATGRK